MSFLSSFHLFKLSFFVKFLIYDFTWNILFVSCCFITEPTAGQKRHLPDDRETLEDLTPLRNRVSRFLRFLHCGHELKVFSSLFFGLSLYVHLCVVFMTRLLVSLLQRKGNENRKANRTRPLRMIPSLNLAERLCHSIIPMWIIQHSLVRTCNKEGNLYFK